MDAKILLLIPLIKVCNLSMILFWVAMRSSRREINLFSFSCSLVFGYAILNFSKMS